MIRKSLAAMMTQREPRAFRTLGNDSGPELDTDLEFNNDDDFGREILRQQFQP